MEGGNCAERIMVSGFQGGSDLGELKIFGRGCN